MSEASLTPRGAETRRRLLVAAMDELVAREGTLEVAAVASRAAVSVGLLYRYFGAKAGLIAAVVEDWYDRLEHELGDVEPHLEDADWAAVERRRTERLVQFHYREALAPVILGLLAREPTTAVVEARRIHGLIEQTVERVETGQANGVLPEGLDTRLIASVLVGGFRGAIAEALTRRERPAPEVLTAELWRMIADGVRYRGDAA